MDRILAMTSVIHISFFVSVIIKIQCFPFHLHLVLISTHDFHAEWYAVFKLGKRRALVLVLRIGSYSELRYQNQY